MCVSTVAVSRFRPFVRLSGEHRRTVPILSMAPREACIRLIYIRQTIRSCVLKLLSPRGRLRKTRWVRPIHTSRLAAVVIDRHPNSPTWISFWGVTRGRELPLRHQAARSRSPCLQHYCPCVLLIAGSSPIINFRTYLNRAGG